jgi:hypothetical protein
VASTQKLYQAGVRYLVLPHLPGRTLPAPPGCTKDDKDDDTEDDDIHAGVEDKNE